MDKEIAVAMAAHLTRALLDRVLEVVALGMVFGLACWAMWNRPSDGAYIAGGFAIFAYLWCLLIVRTIGARHAENGRQGAVPVERDERVPPEGAD